MKISRSVRVGGQIFLALILLAFVGRFIARDWSELLLAIRQASVWQLVLSLICFSMGSFTIAVLWHKMLAILGTPISQRAAIRAFYLAILGKYVPGKVWSASARIIISTRAGAASGVAGLGVVLESILLIVSAGAVGGIAISQWPGELPWVVRITPLMSPALLVLVHPRILNRILPVLSRKMPSWVILPDTMPSFKAMLMITWMYCGIWVWWGAGFFFAISSLQPLTVDHFVPVIGGNSLAWLVGFVAVFSPAGIGIREVILMTLTAGHAGTGIAALAVVMARVFTLTGEVAGAAIVGFFRKSSGNLEPDG